jgi:exodeoxyribonuclease VII small subunit
MGKRKPTFEEALKELETIAEKIEQGKIGLEESITQYERGMALVKQCREILSKAEHKIQKLQPRPDGTLETTPLETSGGTAPQ